MNKKTMILFSVFLINLLVYTQGYAVSKNTGTRSGRVIDAVTGKPIEGAVVSYQWDISGGFIEWTTRHAALYETITDKNGKYFIPSQRIKMWGDFRTLEPERVLVYKNGYVGYHVSHGEAQSFITYLPDLKQKYRQRGNIVKLQPWVERLSHVDHMGIPEGGLGFIGPKLEKATESERQAAQAKWKNNEVFREHARKVYNQLTNSKRAYERKEITKQEYIRLLRIGLDIRSVENVKFASSELKKFGDDTTAIPVLIELAKDNIYKKSFGRIYAQLCILLNKPNLMDDGYKTDIPQRLGKIAELKALYSVHLSQDRVHRYGKILINSSSPLYNFGSQTEAVGILCEIGDSKALPYLIQYLDSGKSHMLYADVVTALAKIGDKSAIPHIKEKLRHRHSWVRTRAALALNKLGDNSGLPVMIESLKSDDKNSRSEAASTLSEITGIDFCDGKFLFSFSPQEEQEIIRKWLDWWKNNKDRYGSGMIAENTKHISSEHKGKAHQSFKEEVHQPSLDSKALLIDPTLETDDPNDSPLAVFKKFRNALLEDDLEKVLSCLVPYKREDQEYRDFYKKLRPHFTQMAKDMKGLVIESKEDNLVVCDLLREEDGEIFGYPVRFVKDADGNWFIEDF